MTTVQIAANPFALMMDPESVFAALAHSDRLARLKSRVCRPLDKPLIARTDSDTAAFDNLVDAAGDQDE
jgi:hypothetical protein